MLVLNAELATAAIRLGKLEYRFNTNLITALSVKVLNYQFWVWAFILAICVAILAAKVGKMANVWAVKGFRDTGDAVVFENQIVHHSFNALKLAVRAYVAENGARSLKGIVDYQVTLVSTDG